MRRLALIALLSMLSACSVKTDRSLCPGLLSLRVEDGVTGAVRLSLWKGGECVLEEPDLLPELRDGSYEIILSRGRYFISAASGRSLGRKTVYTVSPGCQMDSVFAWAGGFSLLEDEQSLSVDLRKQFATVHIRKPESFSGDDWGFMMRGAVDGIDLLTLTPHQGAFWCRAEREDDWYCSLRIPRQVAGIPDEGLGLVLESFDGRQSFDLTLQLLRSGYDWTAPQLEDIYVDFDAVDMQMQVGIGDWASDGSGRIETI